MDNPADSRIRLFESELVLQKQTGGSPDAYWVNLAIPIDDASQRWSYNHIASRIANFGSDCMLSIWGINAVICARPVGFEPAPQTGDAARPADAAQGDLSAWQLQIVGGDDAKD
jgi:hypothetical protein